MIWRKILPAFVYATLVWLTGLLTVPTLFIIWGASKSRNFWHSLNEGLVYCAETVSNVTLWSSPAWLVFAWASYEICKLPDNKWKKKVALCAIGLSLILLSIGLCGLGDSDAFYLLTLYWLPGLLSIFLFKLPKARAMPQGKN